MISETVIDKVLDQFESETFDYEAAVQDFVAKQPDLFSYLVGDNEGVFSEDEEDFLLYLSLVVFRSVEAGRGGSLPAVAEGDISEAEEANWSLMEASKAADFHSRLDAFYETSPEEDLMAFVEDAIAEGGEGEDGAAFELTPEGREPMFVALKTVIDVLTAE